VGGVSFWGVHGGWGMRVASVAAHNFAPSISQAGSVESVMVSRSERKVISNSGVIVGPW